MNWRRLYDHMDDRQRLEMLQAMLKRASRPHRHLRPIHLLFPAMLAQILIMIFSIDHSGNMHLERAAIGYLFVAAFAMLPSTSARPSRIHWVN